MAAFATGVLNRPSKSKLEEAFLGRNLKDVLSPAAVIDRAILQRNCDQMLDACRSLQVEFRPHVKTHKTIEATQAQIGDVTNKVNIIVSTVAEAEYLVDYLKESKDKGMSVNVLYGIPLPPSQIPRLASLGARLGPNSISVLVDDLSQLPAAKTFEEMTGFQLLLFIKIDTGYRRAGLLTGTAAFQCLVHAVFQLQLRHHGVLAGFYCHAGHSYGANSSLDALKILIEEIGGLERAATEANKIWPSNACFPRYCLSVGATPSATSIETLLKDRSDPTTDALRTVIERVQKRCFVELHAGVYPFLDMQQLATQASPSAMAISQEPQAAISFSDIALFILVEVASVYDSRNEPEALIAAGTLALSREPCKSYDGWGIVSDWSLEATGPTRQSGWKVGRISQEHGILTQDPASHRSEVARLHVGQKLKVWPNHACVAGAGFSWYLIVDSSLPGNRRDEIVDVWIRCREW